MSARYMCLFGLVLSYTAIIPWIPNTTIFLFFDWVRPTNKNFVILQPGFGQLLSSFVIFTVKKMVFDIFFVLFFSFFLVGFFNLGSGQLLTNFAYVLTHPTKSLDILSFCVFNDFFCLKKKWYSWSNYSAFWRCYKGKGLLLWLFL